MDAIFDISLEEILAFVEDLLRKIKQAFAEFGILVLPEEGEGHNTTTATETE